MPKKSDSIIKPQAESIVTLTNITWETDGERVKLPKSVKVKIYYQDNDSLDQIFDMAMDGASNGTGWLIKDCTMANIKLL